MNLTWALCPMPCGRAGWEGGVWIIGLPQIRVTRTCEARRIKTLGVSRGLCVHGGHSQMLTEAPLERTFRALQCLVKPPLAAVSSGFFRGSCHPLRSPISDVDLPPLSAPLFICEMGV